MTDRVNDFARAGERNTPQQFFTIPETSEAAAYVMIVTTMMDLPAGAVLALYRLRWQIGLTFKRLKSLLQLGHLKKSSSESAMAWLQGKLLVALIIEKLITPEMRAF